MSSEVRDHCGVVVCHSLHDTRRAMEAIQHRGQDTAGIAARSEDGIDVLRWQGRVSDFSLDSIHRLLQGDMFIGHVRYATSGGETSEELFAGAHPRFIGGNKTAEYFRPPHPHIVARGATKAAVHNGTLVGVDCSGDDIDTDVMLRAYDRKGIGFVLSTFPAAYAAAILDAQSNEAMVFRDRHGIRPLWIGRKDGKIVAASEDVAIWEIGGKPIREVKPGEVIYISPNGSGFRSEQSAEAASVITPCFFEHHYNSALSSTFCGRSVNDVCYKLGVELANEYRPDVDIVTYLPNRPESTARGYAEARNLPLVEIFYKVEKVRAFLGATEELRAQLIWENLFLLDNADLKGKRILIIDDSIVRFNNGPDAEKKVRERGASWIGFGVGTPPIGPEINGQKYGCTMGVDMPPDDNFAIRRYGTVEDMIAKSGFDDIHYISREGMSRAHGVPLESMCTYCLGGPDPVYKQETEEMRRALMEIDM